jgi:hypothetical protein
VICEALMGLFQEGHASEASVTGDVLTVPLVTERPVPGWLPFERILFKQTSRSRSITVRFNLARLAFVSFDYNDQWHWFDLKDARGQSLRLVFAATTPTERERAVLRALREHVVASQLQIDADTEAALTEGP